MLACNFTMHKIVKLEYISIRIFCSIPLPLASAILIIMLCCASHSKVNRLQESIKLLHMTLRPLKLKYELSLKMLISSSRI